WHGKGVITDIGTVVASRAGSVDDREPERVIEAANFRDCDGQRVEQCLATSYGPPPRSSFRACPVVIETKGIGVESCVVGITAGRVIDPDVKGLPCKNHRTAGGTPRGEAASIFIVSLRSVERGLESNDSSQLLRRGRVHSLCVTQGGVASLIDQALC